MLEQQTNELLKMVENHQERDRSLLAKIRIVENLKTFGVRHANHKLMS